MTIKPHIIIIIAMLFLSSAIESFAVEEWCNKVKLKKTLELPAIEGSYEQVYDLDKDEFSAYKYALELGIGLIKHIEFAVEYKYIDNKRKKDGEELEPKLICFCNLPFEIEIKDENKWVADIRSGQQQYENEIELVKELFSFSEDKTLSLLLGDTIVYDIDTDEWTENESCAGIEIGLSKNCTLEVKYSYIDVLNDSHNSSKMETELKFSF